MTRASVSPRLGCRKAPGRRPTVSKPRPMPKPDGPRVRGDDEIELHRRETPLPRTGEGVLAKLAGDAPSDGCLSCHETAVGDVGTAAGLVGAEVGGAQHLSVLLGDEGLAVGAQPIGQGVSLRHRRIEGVGLPRADHRHDDAADGGAVGLARTADRERAHPNCSRRMRSSRLWPGSCRSTSSVPPVEEGLHRADPAELGVVGHRRHGPVGGLQHVDADPGVIRQQRTAPSPRAEGGDGGQRQELGVERQDLASDREVVGRRAGSRGAEHAVGDQQVQAHVAVDGDLQLGRLVGLAQQVDLVDRPARDAAGPRYRRPPSAAGWITLRCAASRCSRRSSSRNSFIRKPTVPRFMP